MIKKLGLKSSIKNDKEIGQLFKHIDANGNKKVSYQEFCAVFTDKKALGIEEEGSKDLEYETFIEELKAKMQKRKKTPEDLFYGMEDEFEGEIRQKDFFAYFEENRLSEDKQILGKLFEECKKQGTKLLDFKKFFKRISQELTEDKEEKARNADKFWVVETIKIILAEQYETRKTDYFATFERFDTSRLGAWKYDDFIDFIEQYSKKFTTKQGKKPSEKVLKKTFDYLDAD